MHIHPTAIIDPSANIHPSVKIGAFCVIGHAVSIGADSVLHSHVVIAKNTRIGERNEIFQFASIGEDCQDLKYQGEETWLEIGCDNRIREACSLHRGTAQDKGLTKIGNRNLFMVNTHIAHDCQIGDDNILANNVGIAGHVVIGNHVVVGGNCGIHQFCRIDDFSMIGGASLILKDVGAFNMVSGNPAKSHGLNVEGMKRRDWPVKTIDILKEAYKIIYRSGLVKQAAIDQLQPLLAQEPKVQLFIDSLMNSQRGLTR
ncbi:UDP-N-acetylglucosamine acyltransferase [Moraxella macacae 0408225]|uniref:UDP-N-acetylglucosamine acyltransferase n=1 Tax=Moraxella macacae 0408225 TaxID=1230338 RepID=L2F5X8_9GAMM|nr:acyl-ACP--UDP-N-acetylglucosamine O-acyltransferase [Moraxella macacae]ELA08305.1 UDP-N-acetylglucosamine acyltransferase [Moraxella macacae 0408225]